MTHISHAALAEMELGWQEQGEEGAKGRELLLSAMRVTLEPGDNRVVLQGKVGVAREGGGGGSAMRVKADLSTSRVSL